MNPSAMWSSALMSSGVTQPIFGCDSRPTVALDLRAVLRLRFGLDSKVGSYLTGAFGLISLSFLVTAFSLLETVGLMVLF